MFDYVERVLDNGLKCYIVNKPDFEEKKAMVAFSYGSCDNEFILDGALIAQPEGIAHFLEHKMFEDSKRDMFSLFNKLGASANAYTNFTTTAYHFSTIDNFYPAFKLLLEMVSSLYLTQENIKKEKGIITQEINMYKDDPAWLLYFNTLKAAYSANNVRNSVAGTAESVASITRDELELSYKAFYTFNNAAVIAVGDIDEEKVICEIERSLSLGELCGSKTMVEDSPLQHKIVASMPVEKELFTLGYKEFITTENIAQRIAVNNVLLTYLCGNGSRLAERLMNEGVLDLPPSLEYLCGRDYGIRLINGTGKNAERTAQLLENELQSILEHGIKQTELEAAVKCLKGGMDMMEDSIEGISMYIADCFSKDIEIEGIYEEYDRIDEKKLLSAAADFDTGVISIVNKQ